MSRKRYYVTTYDHSKGVFTPQRGVRKGPHTLFGLRAVLRELAARGYSVKRSFAPCVLVEDAESHRARLNLENVEVQQ